MMTLNEACFWLGVAFVAIRLVAWLNDDKDIEFSVPFICFKKSSDSD